MYRNLSPLLSQKPNYVPIVDWTVASTESVRNGGAIEVTMLMSGGGGGKVMDTGARC